MAGDPAHPAALAVSAGIFYLPVGGWIRAFLAVALFYVVTSAFTLAKCVRDAQRSAPSYAGWTRPASTS